MKRKNKRRMILKPGINKIEGGKGEGNGGKIKWKLSEINAGAVSSRQDKLIGKFKMAAVM